MAQIRRNVWRCLMLCLLFVACTAQSSDAIWHETFDAAGDWRLSSDASADVVVRDGQLRIQIAVPGQIAWASAPRVFDDFTLRVAATYVSGPADNEYGVLVRMQDDAHFYAFSISGDGYVRAALYEAGIGTPLGGDWTPSDAVHQGAGTTNVLDLDVLGTDYVFRVNDQEVLRVQDTVYTKGEVGLYAGAFMEGDVVVAFDDMHITPIKEKK